MNLETKTSRYNILKTTCLIREENSLNGDSLSIQNYDNIYN